MLGVFRQQLLPLVLLVGGCSSSKQAERSTRDIGLEPEPVAGEGFDLIASKKIYSTDAGVLFFFRGEDLGMAVTRIVWGRPASESNPGVDCEFRRQRLGPPENKFTCVIDGPGRLSVEVELIEDFSYENGRQLAKIGALSKEVNSYSFWERELKANGYTFYRRYGPNVIELISKSKRTIAFLKRDMEELRSIMILRPR